MTGEEAPTSDADPLLELGAHFGPGLIGIETSQEMQRIRDAMNYRLERIDRVVIPYLANMYSTQKQRQYAEAELFRLQSELRELHLELDNILIMVADMGYPLVSTNH